MNDYIEEIKLSRELTNAIAEEIATYGTVVPHSVIQAYNRLVRLYARQIEEMKQ